MFFFLRYKHVPDRKDINKIKEGTTGDRLRDQINTDWARWGNEGGE